MENILDDSFEKSRHQKVVEKSQWFVNGEERILTIYEDGSAIYECYTKKYKKWVNMRFVAKGEEVIDMDDFIKYQLNTYYEDKFYRMLKIIYGKYYEFLKRNKA